MTRRKSWKMERDYILRTMYGDVPSSRPDHAGIPSLDDTRPIPAPSWLPLPFPLPGDCMVWRWGLNSDGYGTFDNRLAHREAYRDSHPEWDEKGNILHLCGRPYCIQPGHFYLGDAKQNRRDWKAVTGKLYDWKAYANLPVGADGPETLRRILAEAGDPLLWYGETRMPHIKTGSDVKWDASLPNLKQSDFAPPLCQHLNTAVWYGTMAICALCAAIVQRRNAVPISGDSQQCLMLVPIWYPQKGYIAMLSRFPTVPLGTRMQLLSMPAPIWEYTRSMVQDPDGASFLGGEVKCLWEQQLFVPVRHE